MHLEDRPNHKQFGLGHCTHRKDPQDHRFHPRDQRCQLAVRGHRQGPHEGLEECQHQHANVNTNMPTTVTTKIISATTSQEIIETNSLTTVTAGRTATRIWTISDATTVTMATKD